MQKVLIVTTERSSMRSDIQGWTFENGNDVIEAFTKRIGTEFEYEHINEIPVGMIGGTYKAYAICYKTVLHAIGDGWKLLAPPQEYKESNLQTMYEWWLVKD